MSLRSCVMVIGLFVIANAGGSMALAQQGNEAQDSTASPPMSAAPQVQQNPDSRVASLHLEEFEAATGAPLSCGDSCPKDVMERVSWVKAWYCIAKACDSTGDKKPTSCLAYFKDKKELGDKLLCNMAQSPGTETIQLLIKAFSPPGSQGEGFVEGAAYIYALQGNAKACQAQIKNYIGPYGPSWNERWYKDMSGCRILAQKRTREEEENDFSAWFGGNCADIINAEMRNACNVSGASFLDVK